MYESQFGGDVVMGCRFQPKSSDPSADLKVTWHWIKPESDREVYQMNNGAERSASPEYQGRVRLLTEELREGWAKLKVITCIKLFPVKIFSQPTHPFILLGITGGQISHSSQGGLETSL